MDLAKLAQPFPADAISWRAQTMNKEGTSALALAYLTARDVMDRLDEVCGPANWQDRYEVHGDKTICYLSIRIGGEWISKADGGGDSDIEGEKGALSGALKRAAVKWGIGRYLYDLGNTWVGCQHYERQGKKHWKKWTEEPWTKVRNARAFLPPDSPAPQSRPEPEASVAPEVDDLANSMLAVIEQLGTIERAERWWDDQSRRGDDERNNFDDLTEEGWQRVSQAFKRKASELQRVTA